MKKLLIMLLGVLIALPAVAYNGEYFEYTHEGQTLSYRVISETDKTVRTNTGHGANGTPGNNVSGVLIIPETVSYNGADYKVIEIGESGFIACSGLTSVTIPNSVTSIGESAFWACRGLTSVVIPNSVTTIGMGAFCNCFGLKSVTIGNSVTSIGDYVFASCESLTNIEIPGSVTSIGNDAFYECFGLTSVIIPTSVTSINEKAFKNCTGLKKSAYPSTIKNNPFPKGAAVQYPAEGAIIEDGIVWGPDKSAIYFASLNLEGGLVIPNSITSIGDRVFEDCTSLKSVIIPTSVTSIGDNAFSGCSGLIRNAYPSTIESPFPKGIAVQYPADGAIIEDGFVWSSDKSTIYFAPLDLVGKYEIPNSVTSIGKNAFARCTGLTSVTIGNGVTSIGNYIFYCCSGLTSVTIPNSVTSIGEGAFYNCSGLTSITIPNSVTSIGRSAFSDCYGLTSIDIPGSVSSIGNEAFQLCFNLKSVTIGNGVTSIGFHAFYTCDGLTSIDIPNSVTSIGNYAFENCYGLTSVTIPNSVTSISDGIFTSCTSLTSVTIPNSVTSIGNSAFSGCSGLTSIELKAVTPPNYYSAFDSYKSAATLTIPDGTYPDYLASDWQNFLKIKDASGSALASFNDQVFTYRYMPDSGEAILVNGGNYSSMTSASIPDRIYVEDGDAPGFYNVTGIAANAFNGCTNLTQLKISANCTFIASNAFAGCSGLTSVEIPNSVTSIGEDAFKDCSGLEKVEIHDLAAWCGIEFGNYYANPLDYAHHLYMNGSEITELVIPDGVTSIGNHAFVYCTGLTSVTIPNSVTSIGNSAFNGCSGLTSVTIPNSVTSIGSFAFQHCSGLTSVEIPNSVQTIEKYAFSYCEKLTSIEIPNSVTSIGEGVFWRSSALTSATIPNSVTSIDYGAFRDCTSLTSVTIPNSVTSIGIYAFNNCPGLTSVTLEDGIDELNIGSYAFDGVNPTTVYLGRNYNGYIPVPVNLTIGSFVTSFPENAFKGNEALESLTITNGLLQSIGASAFEGCSNLKEVIFPENYVEIGEKAFASTGLTELTLPSGEIAANAFSGLNLTEVVLGSEVAVIGENAFDGSNALKNVYSTPSTPPAAQNNSFSYYEGQLWVPEEAINTYYNTAPCWYRFSAKALVIPEEMKVYGQPKLQGYAGETFQLTAELSPADVTLDRILWQSTNPAIATVDNNGLVTIHNFDLSDASTDVARAIANTETRTVEIIASTLYENGPKAVVTIDIETSSIEYITSDPNLGGSTNRPNDIYNLQGVCLKRNASQDDIDALAPGLYIIAGEKVLVK